MCLVYVQARTYVHDSRWRGETRGGVIDKFTPLQLKIGNHTKSITFDISMIGYDFILGMS